MVHLRPWLPFIVIMTLIIAVNVYDRVSGGSWLDLFFEPPVKPPVWAPFTAEQIRSDDPEFLRGVAAYDREDLAGAYAIWLPLAEAGDAEAQYQVGRLLRRGWGIEQDNATAAKWLTRATEKSHGKAMNLLGYMYDHGIGVSKHKSKAVELYKSSMDLGYLPGKFNVGISLLTGDGTIKNVDKATKIFEELAQENYCRAHQILGGIYSDGNDSTRLNLKKAYRHYVTAKKEGCDAEASRTLLQLRMNPTVAEDVERELE